MKILLLTDIPPCRNFTAGLVLAQMCRLLPRGSVACFTILNRHLQPDYCPDLDWLPIEVTVKPNEFGRPPRLPRLLGLLVGVPVESFRRLVLAPRLARRAEKFARAQEADMIWAVLQGQTMVRVARKLARRLGAPLISHVWDPLPWWLEAHRVDGWNRRITLRQFDDVMRHSASCVAASWAMAAAYHDRYGIPAVPVISSHDAAQAAAPAQSLRKPHEVVIGMAGQLYALEEWLLLLAALDHAGWQIAGRVVRLLMIGPPPITLPAHCTALPWTTSAAAIRSLAEDADILYCPYPFAPAMDEVSRLSFPSKLPLYFAAGRPVVFHGPLHASPARYLADTNAAVICGVAAPAAIYNELERLVISPALYAQMAGAAHAAFRRDFTLERMRQQLFAALRLPPPAAPPPTGAVALAAGSGSASANVPPDRNARSADRNPLGGRFTFAAVWIKAWIACIMPQRMSVMTLGQPTTWKQRSRQRAKRLLTRVPAVRRYLEEKYILQDSWDRAAAERDALGLERGALQTEAERQRAELEVAVAAGERLRAEIDALQAARAAAAVERQAQDTEMAGLRDALTAGAAAREGIRSEIDALHASLKPAVAERDSLRIEIASLGATVKAAAAERDMLRSDIAGLHAALQGAAAERSRLQADIEGHLAALHAAATERSRLQTEIDSHLGALQAAAADRGLLQADAETKQATETAERDRLRAALQASEQALAAASAERESQRAALAAGSSERDELRTALDRLQFDLEAQRNTLQAVAAERDGLQTAATALRDTLQATAAERDALQLERRGLQADVEGQRATLTAIAEERDRYLAITQRLQAEVAKLTDQFARHTAEHQDATLGKLAIMQSQVGTLQDNLIRLANTPAEAISGELSRSLYLDLLEDSLVGTLIKDDSIAPWSKGYDEKRRELGRDWPRLSLTMIGKARMRNIRELAETVLRDGVPGDFLESGVWRGGACIYMRGILKAYGVTDRVVWAADSFAGLPPPDQQAYPADAGDSHHAVPALAVPLPEVRENFARYGLLDGQVKFLEGWFKDTLANAPIKRLALLRLDGDMYESTIQTMDALYPKLSPGGIVIVDDYVLAPCQQAIDDYRARHGITAKLEAVDGAAVYWRKSPDPSAAAKPARVAPKRRRS